MASACYVYAIVDHDAALPDTLVGMNGEPLALAPSRQLAAVISAIDASGISPRADLLVQYETVVEAVCRMTPALPARFGTVLPNMAAVIRSLDEHYDTLLADLKRIGDKQELGVTVLWDAEEASPGGNREAELNPDAVQPVQAEGRGTRYLLARREAYRRGQATREQAQALANELDERLRPYVRESRYIVRATPRVSLHAAYLLDRDALRPARDALAGYQEGQDVARLLVTGPWPPYSFVGMASELRGRAGERILTVDGSPAGAGTSSAQHNP